MDVLSIVVTILLVVLLYKVVVWGLGKLKIAAPEGVLELGFLLLLILALLGRVSIGL